MMLQLNGVSRSKSSFPGGRAVFNEAVQQFCVSVRGELSIFNADLLPLKVLL